jgi:hypothetical protein
LFFSQTTEIKLDNKETLYSEEREIEGGIQKDVGPKYQFQTWLRREARSLLHGGKDAAKTRSKPPVQANFDTIWKKKSLANKVQSFQLTNRPDCTVYLLPNEQGRLNGDASDLYVVAFNFES